jgi:hypothetical protein
VRRDRLDTGHRPGLARDLIDEIEAGVAAWPLVGQHRGQRRQPPIRQPDGGHPVLLQAVEHIGEPLARAGGMAVGIEIIGPLHQAGKQRAFRRLERLHRFPKIRPRRQLDAPGAAAEIDGVEVKLEDVVLAELPFDPRRHDHLADLARVGQVVSHQQVFRDLLSDGRAALQATRLGKVADEGADQAGLVDTPVAIEVLVFGRHKCVADLLRNVGQRHPHAPPVLLEHLCERLAFAIEHDAGAGQLDALEPGVVGQVGGRLVVEVDHIAEVDRGHRHLLVLAELPIRGL